MTLEEMKIKVYSLIEEYNENSDNLTDDEDLATKINSVINQIQNELSRFKKIPAYTTVEVAEGQEYKLDENLDNFYQLNKIKDVDYDIFDNLVIFNEEGTAKIYYYKYPEQINIDTDDSYTFELSNDILEIMPYGVAGDLLKSDVSSNYGVIYYNRYRDMIKELDPRYSLGNLYIDGGMVNE